MADGNYLFLDTRYGRIVMEMRPDLAPLHVAQITTLTNQGFYDGLPFHRVVANFVAQTGLGNSGLPDLPLESQGLPFVRGVVGMARVGTDLNSANSQFFITYQPVTLNGPFTVWAEVATGMEFADRLALGEPPPIPDRIERMTVEDPNVVEGGAGDQTLAGGADVDLITGGDGNDSLSGLAGDDMLDGGNGNDALAGGDGDDQLVGGAGNDTLTGGNGGDRIEGSGGTDTAVVAGARAQYHLAIGEISFFLVREGGSVEGIDELTNIEQVTFSDGTVASGTLAPTPITLDGIQSVFGGGNDFGTGSATNDSLSGGNGNDTLAGLGGSDGLFGGNGNDVIFGDIPGAGDDVILGGNGNDTVFASGGDDSVVGDHGLDFLILDDGEDTAVGGTGDDVIFGGADDDFLLGETGVDFLFGDGGSDTMSGGQGNDRLHVDAGDALADGGEGVFDVLVVLANAGGLTAIDLGNALNQNATGSGPILQGFEAVDASIASAPVSIAGADFNGFGNVLFASAFADTVTGSALADIILGGGGADILAGGNGDDTIIADAGSDTLTGGAGADDFFHAGGTNDVRVADFLPADDTVVLAASLGFASGAAALAAVTQAGADAVLNFGNGGSVTLAGVNVAALTAADFEIV